MQDSVHQPYLGTWTLGDCLILQARILDRIETAALSSLDSLTEHALQNRTRGKRAQGYDTGALRKNWNRVLCIYIYMIVYLRSGYVRIKLLVQASILVWSLVLGVLSAWGLLGLRGLGFRALGLGFRRPYVWAWEGASVEVFAV